MNQRSNQVRAFRNQKKGKRPATDQDLVAEVRRHWFGLISVYILTCLTLFLVLFVIKNQFLQDIGFWDSLVFGVLLIFSLLVIFFLIAKIYASNKLTISAVDVRQMTRDALFSTKSSVLGLANIEDVTVVRKGVFAHIFNYGTLNIETAGEQVNFQFIYCPQPEKHKQLLMQARQKYLEEANVDQTLR